MCPTRELVLQNLAVLERMGRFSGITSTSTAAADYGASRRARIEDQVGAAFLLVGLPGFLFVEGGR